MRGGSASADARKSALVRVGISANNAWAMKIKNPLISQKRRWWLVLGLAMGLACLSGEAAGQIQMGSLVSLQGNVRIERGGQAVTATQGISIRLGDKIETSPESEVTILLADGSRLTLSESTTILIDRSMVNPDPTDSIVNLAAGKLRSVITPKNGNLPQFEVHTPNAVVGVRGTDFETEYIAGKPCPGFPQCQRYTDVGVFHGVVEVSNPTSAKPVTVRVSGGYETTGPCELPPANPAPLGMGDLSAPGYH